MDTKSRYQTACVQITIMRLVRLFATLSNAPEIIKLKFETRPFPDDVTTNRRAMMPFDWPNPLLGQVPLKIAS